MNENAKAGDSSPALDFNYAARNPLSFFLVGMRCVVSTGRVIPNEQPPARLPLRLGIRAVSVPCPEVANPLLGRLPQAPVL